MKIPDAFYIKPSLFALLTLGFVLATIVGTVSHEFGHYLPAKAYGYDAKLHYAMVSYGSNPEEEEMISYYENHKAKIMDSKPSPEKAAFRKWMEEQQHKRFITVLGGPVQTMATGTLGLILLWAGRKKIRLADSMTGFGWLAVYLAFFWSRQVLNFLMSLPLIFQERTHFRSDEPNISLHLGLPHWAFGMITAIIGAILLIWVVFTIIPAKQRYAFILAGITGSILGWFLWLETLGPIVMP